MVTAPGRYRRRCACAYTCVRVLAYMYTTGSRPGAMHRRRRCTSAPPSSSYIYSRPSRFSTRLRARILQYIIIIKSPSYYTRYQVNRYWFYVIYTHCVYYNGYYYAAYFWKTNRINIRTLLSFRTVFSERANFDFHEIVS